GETNPRLVRMGPSISRIPQSPSPKPAHTRTPKPVESKFDQDFDRFMNGLENFEPFVLLHRMNENALHVEVGILLLAHPKHTYSKIGGLTDSDCEYSSNSEDELDGIIQYSKQGESNSTKNSKSGQDSLPNLVIYATPQGQT